MAVAAHSFTWTQRSASPARWVVSNSMDLDDANFAQRENLSCLHGEAFWWQRLAGADTNQLPFVLRSSPGWETHCLQVVTDHFL